MKILLYNPDNGITRNFMPHLWMFLLQSLTPKEHEVILIDGNAKAMSRPELVQFCKDNDIGLVGIGAMTRMVARAYLVADSLREAGFKVVMGGPHVTECPDEALGRDGGPRHADAVALGEADETWPLIVADAARGELKDIYMPEVDPKGNDSHIRIFPGKLSISISFRSCQNSHNRSYREWARVGASFSSSRSKPDAVARMAANSVLLQDFSGIRYDFAQTRASSRNY